MTLRHRIAIAAAAAFVVAAPLAAYSVQPMIYAMTPTGAGSSVRLTVANPREAQLNVELVPFRVTADDQGKRVFTPAPDDFLLFPPQASIPGDRSQNFQVRYVGASQLDQGRVYVVRVHQTNTIDTIRSDPNSNAQTQLKLALNFNTTAIVQPRSLAPQLVVERDLLPDAKGVLHARIANKGPGVADLTRADWTIDRGGKAQPIAAGDVKYGDAVFLEPGHSRDISLSPTITGAARLSFGGAAGRNAGDK